MNETIVILGSANGSRNLGDECMWLGAAACIREALPNHRIVTDAEPGWSPPVADVEAHDFLYWQLRRGVRLGLRRRSVLERMASRPFRREAAARYARELADPTRKEAEEWRSRVRASAAIIFSGAGAICDDYETHGVYSWSLVAEWARQSGVPYFLIGQGIGPLAHAKSRSVVAEMLNGAEMVGVRDVLSKTVAQRLGVSSERITLDPDWALSVPVDSKSRAKADEILQEYLGDSSFIAVSVHRRVSTSRTDLRRLALKLMDVAGWCESTNRRVLFVPNMTGGRYSDDRQTARSIIAGWPKNLQDLTRVHDGQSDASVVKAILERADYCVSTRYHPLVFALAAGTPSLGIAYDGYYTQKLRGASLSFGIDGNVLGLYDEWIWADLVCSLGVTEVEAEELSQRIRAPLVSRLASALRERSVERKGSTGSGDGSSGEAP